MSGSAVFGFVNEVPLPADVGLLARALGGEPGLVVLASDPRGALAVADARFSFVAASPVETSTAWVPAFEAGGAGWAGFPAAPRWVGAIPYDAGRAVERRAYAKVPGAPDGRPAPAFAEPRWHRYDAVTRIDHATGRVAIEADSSAAGLALAARLRDGVERERARAVPPFSLALAPDVDDPTGAHHEARVRAVLELIARGDVYQVNLARRIAFEVKGSRLALFLALRSVAPAPYGFFADFGDLTVAASSPELGLHVSGVTGTRLRTAPMKGTRPRGVDARSDDAHARALDADPKERAELTMAIDLHRNDLGRVAVPGSVRVLGEPRVLEGRTVWSRAAEIVARRRDDVSLEDVVRSVVPCGSVTGAPKVRAMEIIASLEPHRRGLYTGAFGYVGRDGGLVLAVAIRTLEIAADGHGVYGSGGGIVADSDPSRELDETRWKATQLRALESWPP